MHWAKGPAKKSQNCPQSTPKRPQEEPKRVKEAIPNDKTTREPNQDDPKTVLGPGAPKNGRKGVQEDQKIEPKLEDEKRRERAEKRGKEKRRAEQSREEKTGEEKRRKETKKE